MELSFPPLWNLCNCLANKSQKRPDVGKRGQKKKLPLNKYFPFSWYRDAIHPILPNNALLENAVTDRRGEHTCCMWPAGARIYHLSFAGGKGDSIRDFPSGAQLVGSPWLTLLHKMRNPLALHPPQCELGTLAHAPDLGHLGSNLTHLMRWLVYSLFAPSGCEPSKVRESSFLLGTLRSSPVPDSSKEK